jgi:hypothetical protein
LVVLGVGFLYTLCKKVSENFTVYPYVAVPISLTACFAVSSHERLNGTIYAYFNIYPGNDSRKKLNHPRGWDRKPIGSHRDSRVAELSDDMVATWLFVYQGSVESRD